MLHNQVSRILRVPSVWTSLRAHQPTTKDTHTPQQPGLCLVYSSCPQCSTKATEDKSTGAWRCKKCTTHIDSKHIKWTFRLSLCISPCVDDTTVQNTVAFGAVAERVLGCTADQWVEEVDCARQRHDSRLLAEIGYAFALLLEDSLTGSLVDLSLRRSFGGGHARAAKYRNDFVITQIRPFQQLGLPLAVGVLGLWQWCSAKVCLGLPISPAPQCICLEEENTEDNPTCESVACKDQIEAREDAGTDGGAAVSWETSHPMAITDATTDDRARSGTAEDCDDAVLSEDLLHESLFDAHLESLRLTWNEPVTGLVVSGRQRANSGSPGQTATPSARICEPAMFATPIGELTQRLIQTPKYTHYKSAAKIPRLFAASGRPAATPWAPSQVLAVDTPENGPSRKRRASVGGMSQEYVEAVPATPLLSRSEGEMEYGVGEELAPETPQPRHPTAIDFGKKRRRVAASITPKAGAGAGRRRYQQDAYSDNIVPETPSSLQNRRFSRNKGR